MRDDTVVRTASVAEVEAIARLNNGFAADGLMLYRSPETIAMAIDDYVVAVDRRGDVVACGALKEYSPSVAEIARRYADTVTKYKSIAAAHADIASAFTQRARFASKVG